MSEGCVFCAQSWMRAAEIFIETPHCIFASTRDPDIRAQAGLAEGVLPGSGAIVPIAAVHLGHPMSRDALVRSRHTPVSPRNLKRRRMSAAATPASRKDAR